MEENEIGHINIKVTDLNVEYDTEFALPEVVFWLETLKAMILERVLKDNNGE